jgi:hypothetical protein
MGWSSGSGLFNEVWGTVREYVPEEKRPEVCAKVIDKFTHMDWDNLEDIDEFPEREAALKLYDPTWGEEEDWENEE